MGRPHEWLTTTLPNYFSAWLLHAYQRPFRFLLGLVILPLLAILVATHAVNVNLGRQQSLHNLGVTAELGANLVSTTLNDTVLFERMIAVQPGFVEAVRGRDAEKITQALERDFSYAPPGSNLVAVIDPDGAIMAFAPGDAERIGRDISADDVFQGARTAEPEPYVSAVYLRGVSWAEKVVGIALPIMDAKHTVGWLMVQYRADVVKSWFQKLRVKPKGFLYVVDQRSQLVAYPFQVLPGRPRVVADWPTVMHPLESEGAQFVYHDPNTRERWLAGIYPVGTTGWRVVAIQPESAVYQLVHGVMWPMGILVGLLVLIVVGVSFRWVQLQAFSVRLLRQNAKLLKQTQQRQTLERGKLPGTPKGGSPG